MEAIITVLSEVHGAIISGKPAGYGWLLGLGVLLFYASGLYVLWGVFQAIKGGDAWHFVGPVERMVHWAALVAAACVPVMAVCILYEVIMRYAFNAPTIWAFEVSYMLMGTSLMLGIGYCSQLRRHIRVDFYYDSVTDQRRALIDLAGYIILLLPGAIWITWALFEYWFEAYKVNERTGESAWNPLVWPFKFFFTFGFFLFTLQSIVETLKSILTLMGRDVPAPNTPKGFE